MMRANSDVLGLIVAYLKQNNGCFRGRISLLAKSLDLKVGSVFNAIKNLTDKGVVSKTGDDLVLRPEYLNSNSWREIRRQGNDSVAEGGGKSLAPKVARPNLRNLLGREEILKELMAALQNLKNAQEEILKLQTIIKEQEKANRDMKTSNDRLTEEAHKRDAELREKASEVAQLDLEVKGLLKGTRRNAATIRRFDSSGVMIVPGE
jgi:hypothetical protein